MKVGPAKIGDNRSQGQKRRRKGSKKKRKLQSIVTESAQTKTGACDGCQPVERQGGTGQKYRYRDCQDLYACRETYDCASRTFCVPCAYKIGTFDVSLDKEFTSSVPNVRPEICPRFPSRECSSGGAEGTMGYRAGMDVLTVGDGDLSFSLAVARIVLRGRSDEASAAAVRLKRNQLVATSYESRDTLLRVYPGIDRTIGELESLGVDICYEVDATRLVETLPRRLSQSKPRFHRVVWNFPCSAVPSGQDGQNDEMENNKQLVRLFVHSASSLLREGGEVHMAHKTKPPYNQWQMEKVALEDRGNEGEQRNDGKNQQTCLEYTGRLVLDRCCIPPYVPRKALDKKSFTCHDACVYVFAHAKESGPGRMSEDDEFPLTIKHAGNGEDAALASIIPLTEKMLAELRNGVLSFHNKQKASKRMRPQKKLK